MFKHLLIPTDGSTLSRKAVKAGISFAKTIGAKVTAYYALEMVQPYIVADGAVDIASLKAFEQRARERGEEHLAEVGEAAEAAGIVCEAYITKPATPYQGIVQAAKKKKCDVIFMASHGRGELASLVLGSVTQKVLAHSKLPVMVYR
ncbi:MAG TPA: universal stress protein [Burkholderiales bacterium]|nr:universal stress protein [Burkholderiales bacterium]